MVSEFLLIDYIDFYHLCFLSIFVGDKRSHLNFEIYSNPKKNNFLPHSIQIRADKYWETTTPSLVISVEIDPIINKSQPLHAWKKPSKHSY
jgi:hypothetical protein